MLNRDLLQNATVPDPFDFPLLMEILAGGEAAADRLPIPNVPRKDQPVIIYGAGGFGRSVAGILTKAGYDVRGFIDRSARGQEVMPGLPAYPLDHEWTTSLRASGASAVIGVYNRAYSLGEIIADLTKAGFSHIVTPMELYVTFPAEFGWRFWMGTRDIYRTHLADIEAADALWADERSRDLYRRQIGFRVLYQHDLLPAPDPENQYCPPDLMEKLREPLRNFVDGGAYNGDTLADFAKKGLTFDRVFAFEPDLESFAGLAEEVRKPHYAGAEMLLWPCGLWSSTTRLTFSEGQGEASSVGAGSGVAKMTTISVVALDDVLNGEAIGVLKMDVEGAEPEVVKGALKTLQQHRPVIEMCMYHRPEDLFLLPQQLRDLDLGYDFYLRSHGHNTLETVLYAIPGK